MREVTPPLPEEARTRDLGPIVSRSPLHSGRQPTRTTMKRGREGIVNNSFVSARWFKCGTIAPSGFFPDFYRRKETFARFFIAQEHTFSHRPEILDKTLLPSFPEAPNFHAVETLPGIIIIMGKWSKCPPIGANSSLAIHNPYQIMT